MNPSIMLQKHWLLNAGKAFTAENLPEELVCRTVAYRFPELYTISWYRVPYGMKGLKSDEKQISLPSVSAGLFAAFLCCGRGVQSS